MWQWAVLSPLLLPPQSVFLSVFRSGLLSAPVLACLRVPLLEVRSDQWRPFLVELARQPELSPGTGVGRHYTGHQAEILWKLKWHLPGLAAKHDGSQAGLPQNTMRNHMQDVGSGSSAYPDRLLDHLRGAVCDAHIGGNCGSQPDVGSKQPYLPVGVDFELPAGVELK